MSNGRRTAPWVSVCVALSVGATVADVAAGFRPSFDFERMSTKARSVAVVEVISDETPDSTGTWMVASMAARERWRGGAGLPDRFVFKRQETAVLTGTQELQPGMFFIAFLQPSPLDEGWRMVDLYSLIRVSGRVPLDLRDSDLRSSSARLLRESLADPDRDVVLAALEALELLEDRGAVTQARRLSDATDPRVAARATILLNSLGEFDRAHRVVELLEGPSALTLPDRDQFQLAFSLRGERRRPLPIDELGRLLGTVTNRYLRQALALALSSHGDATSFEVLITCLGDPDRAVRRSCVAGLDRITQGREGPGSEEFMTDPEGTAQAWLAWWAERGNAPR